MDDISQVVMCVCIMFDSIIHQSESSACALAGIFWENKSVPCGTRSTAANDIDNINYV